MPVDVFWAGSRCILGWILVHFALALNLPCWCCLGWLLMYSGLAVDVFLAGCSCILGWLFVYSGMAAERFRAGYRFTSGLAVRFPRVECRLTQHKRIKSTRPAVHTNSDGKPSTRIKLPSSPSKTSSTFQAGFLPGQHHGPTEQNT